MSSLTREPAMEAGWLTASAGRLFACYHPPRGPEERAAAVLLCDPFGSDRMVLHSAYRAVAERLSAVGFPVMRIDYAGTCDSSGYPRDRAQVGAWLESLEGAAEWLRARSGRDELCLFGALLGGTLATVFAGGRPDVTGLVLWGPLPRGRALLRELAAFRATTPANPAGRRPSDWDDGDQEAVGFLLTRETVQELERLDALVSQGLRVRRAAIFRRNRTFPVDRWAEHLRGAGADVYVQPSAVVDIAELYAERAQPPEALLEEMVAWWTQAYPPARVAGQLSLDGSASLEPRTSLESRSGVTVHEEVVRCGPDGDLFAIVTEPDERPDTSRPAIILVNGGVNHRAGINRNYTEWARDLAALGSAVLRIDIRGLGDSPPRAPEELGVLYLDSTRQDVRDAADWLERRYRTSGVVCIGLCAGGYQALHTALEDPRIRGVVMLNPLRFRRVDPSEAGSRGEIDYRSLAGYARRAFDLESWQRIVSGEVDLRGISRSVTRRVGQRATAALGRFGFLVRGRPAPAATWLAGALLDLTERGCDVLIVHSASDGIADIFDEEVALDRARLVATGRLSVELLRDTDHIYSPLWSQEHVGKLLVATLERWSASERRERG